MHRTASTANKLSPKIQGRACLPNGLSNSAVNRKASEHQKNTFLPSSHLSHMHVEVYISSRARRASALRP